MIATISLCALLCAVTLLWVLAPAKNHKAFYAMCFVAALATLGVYLTFGRPDLKAAPVEIGQSAETQYRQLMLDEFTYMDRLSKNQNDADAMIRLAALRIAQGRGGDEAIRLLTRAQELAPHDKRLQKIKTLMMNR